MPSTQDAAQDLLHRDDLTGLYNRRFFNTLYPELTARAAAEGQPLAMLLVDLDYFKSINDTYGHRQGDHVIAHLGGLLHRAVGNDGYAIRYAGDEFALLIPGLAKALAVEVGHRLAEAARSTPLELLDGAGTLQITLSVGVAAMPDDTREPEELFDRADLACAAAKKAGRNQAMGYSEEHTQVVDKLTLYKHFPCPRLVARDELLTRLGQHLFPAYEQRLPMVMLQGPGGVGKSRLLRDLRERADPQRLRVMAAGGLPYLMSQPFGYLSEALGNLIRQDPAAGSHMATSLSP
ncbi:MAG TPA: diguanylate cyclase, partial [Candidatus Nitrosotenuis sp.]|nr:diguanylate cyclase [Candidatus Nitrosotenuis sp.]